MAKMIRRLLRFDHGWSYVV